VSERLKYVSPEYQERLERLAETLVTPERFGKVALADTVEKPVATEEGEV
jgi:hypothetical protein